MAAFCFSDMFFSDERSSKTRKLQHTTDVSDLLHSFALAAFTCQQRLQLLKLLWQDQDVDRLFTRQTDPSNK